MAEIVHLPILSREKEEYSTEMLDRVIDKMVARGELVRCVGPNGEPGIKLTRKGRKAMEVRKREQR